MTTTATYARAFTGRNRRRRADAARAASGLPTPAYIDAIANGVTVKASHFQELRDRVQ
jgi:hypothetical protein